MCNARHAMHMAKVTKSLTLPYEVATALEDNEDNQSEKVEQLLRDEYGL